MLKISVGSVYDVSVTSLWDPEELYVLPTNQRLPSFNDPITAWTSFLPAYTDRIVLARCLQDDSWKRGRILKTEILSPCKLTLELLSPVHTPHTLHTYLPDQSSPRYLDSCTVGGDLGEGLTPQYISRYSEGETPGQRLECRGGGGVFPV